ncbi:MAG: AbgT family transporter, partial [Bacteroidales bacterium]|nr:AbgT family transporter [Bacteroidales bacterium]
DMLGPAMIIGMASGIIFILQEGKIIDTLLYSISCVMAETGEVVSLAGMYLFQTLLNVVMPSGSAKAALPMPIMAPLSDLLHISRQTTVLAFQFGDGFTNMITPTSGILMGVLGAARIPYAVWLKWVYKFILFCIGLGFLLLLPTLYMTFNGF